MDILLPNGIHFDWNDANSKHIEKHDVTPEEAEEIFYQEPQIIVYDKGHSVHEMRYSFQGHTKEGRWLTIIFTFRGKHNEKIRVISARDQSKKERKKYQEEIEKGREDIL
jgi:uncharacterized DUF497 family protein